MCHGPTLVRMASHPTARQPLPTQHGVSDPRMGALTSSVGLLPSATGCKCTVPSDAREVMARLQGSPPAWVSHLRLVPRGGA